MEEQPKESESASAARPRPVSEENVAEEKPRPTLSLRKPSTNGESAAVNSTGDALPSRPDPSKSEKVSLQVSPQSLRLIPRRDEPENDEEELPPPPELSRPTAQSPLKEADERNKWQDPSTPSKHSWILDSADAMAEKESTEAGGEGEPPLPLRTSVAASRWEEVSSPSNVPIPDGDALPSDSARNAVDDDAMANVAPPATTDQRRQLERGSSVSAIEPEPLKKPPPPVSSNKVAAEKGRHLWTGIGVIALLLLIFGGGGYGLYYVLFFDKGTSGEAPAAQQPAAASSGNERVQAAIEAASAVSARADEVTQVAGPSPLTTRPAETRPVPTIVATSEEAEMLIIGRAIDGENAVSGGQDTMPFSGPSPIIDVGSRSPGTSSTETAASTQAIQNFLTSAFIGSVVSSAERPRAVINGVTYNAGDVVLAEYDLRFIGARDGILFFRDANDIVYRKRF